MADHPPGTGGRAVRRGLRLGVPALVLAGLGVLAAHWLDQVRDAAERSH